MLTPVRIAVLVSGGGTNLQALIDAQNCGALHSGRIEAVISSKPEVYALRILEHFHLAEYFDLVCGSLLGGERTDKGEVIAWAMHRMTAEQGIEHPEASAVMVGDREHDMIGAKRNHIPAIGVLFGYGSREELSEAGAWELAETVDDLYLHLTGEVYQGGAL